MAFTDAQKVSIRKYLGYPQIFEGDNYRLQGAIDLIGADAAKQAYVETILAELVTVDAAVAAAGSVSSSQGALKRVDEVEFYSPKDSLITIVDAPKRGKMLCGRLSSALGVPPLSNYFSSAGYADDSWSSAAFQVGSFTLPQG